MSIINNDDNNSTTFHNNDEERKRNRKNLKIQGNIYAKIYANRASRFKSGILEVISASNIKRKRYSKSTHRRRNKQLIGEPNRVESSELDMVIEENAVEASVSSANQTSAGLTHRQKSNQCRKKNKKNQN